MRLEEKKWLVHSCGLVSDRAGIHTRTPLQRIQPAHCLLPKEFSEDSLSLSCEVFQCSPWSLWCHQATLWARKLCVWCGMPFLSSFSSYRGGLTFFLQGMSFSFQFIFQIYIFSHSCLILPCWEMRVPSSPGEYCHHVLALPHAIWSERDKPTRWWSSFFDLGNYEHVLGAFMTSHCTTQKSRGTQTFVTLWTIFWPIYPAVGSQRKGSQLLLYKRKFIREGEFFNLRALTMPDTNTYILTINHAWLSSFFSVFIIKCPDKKEELQREGTFSIFSSQCQVIVH